jgi:hypothetical protein
MITDEDALAEEDLFILDKMKEMISGPEVTHLGAAKQLLGLIERTVSCICLTKLANAQGTFVAKRREPYQHADVSRPAADSDYTQDIQEVEVTGVRYP